MKRLTCMLLVYLLLLSNSAFAVSGLYTPLEKGSKGDLVIQLQTRLNELGFYSIAIDGDYGNGTASAVIAFEKFNGLPATGIASAKLQAFLYSDNAKGIKIQDLEITSVGLRKSYGSYFLRPTLVNHTGGVIKAFTYMLKVYNAAGERIGSSNPLKLVDVCYNGEGNEYWRDYSTGEINGLSIGSGEKYSVRSGNEIDTYSFDQSLTEVVYIAITRYVLENKSVVNIPENDQVWYGSDGSVVVTEYENNMVPMPEYTREIEDRAKSFQLGTTTYCISNFFAEVAELPMGGSYVEYVDDGSLADEAGIRAGDTIVKIGNVWTYGDDSIAIAKGLMDKQNPTRVVFYRKGKKMTAEIATP